MTALEAIKHAQQTGQIAITKQTANLIEAAVNFLDAAEAVATAVSENIPDGMDDNETIDQINTKFFALLEPVQEYVLETVGKINLKRALLYGLTDKFEGL